ncbi:MAG: hypothetical protein HW382_658, partial [Deltaproteobacteria bacterium]|nr:hypothetical protein [Deltaproteobacteria bacterium]
SPITTIYRVIQKIATIYRAKSYSHSIVLGGLEEIS